MGLFSKKKKEYRDDYLLTDDSNHSRYAEWSEQARASRNPEALTPEQLLGILPDRDDDENEVITEEDYVLDSAEVFKGKTANSLYEKMLGGLRLNDEQEEDQEKEEFYFGNQFLEDENSQKSEDAELLNQQEEEPVVQNPIIEEVSFEEPCIEEEEANPSSPRKAYDPSADQFADFFRSLEGDRKAEEKQVSFTEGDKAYSAPAEDGEKELSETDKRSVEDLLALIYGTSKAEPVAEKVTEEVNEPATQEQVFESDEDMKLVPQDDEAPATEEKAEQEDEELEKTRFIDLPEHPVTVPKHSLYKNDYTIDRKAIDDFFNDIDSDEIDSQQDKIKQRVNKREQTQNESVEEVQEYESVQAVFDDDTDDYESLDDAARLKKEILNKRHGLALRMILTIILTGLMVVFNNSFFALNNLDFENIPNIINLVLLIATMAVNYQSFACLFKKEFDSDCCASASGIVVLVQSVVSLFVFDGKGAGVGVLAGLAYCACLVARRAVCSATLKSLCIAATNETKYAVNMMDDPRESGEIVGGLTDDEACLCYSVKSVNVKGILKNWSRMTPTDKKAGTAAIVALTVAVVAALAAHFILHFEVEYVLSVFSITFCLTAAPTLFLPCSLPTKIMTDSLRYYDCTVGGWNAAEALSECNTIVLKASDLFPAGSVVLHKMNPLSANRIDSSIAKAAALTIKAESPLANIFKDIVRDQLHDLPVIEDIKYENKLGLSGWIGNECILIGNRTLMENHNVKTPSIDSERMILSAGYKPVYLAIDGKPCILFVVHYSADSGVKFELCRLCNTGVKVVVDTTDPNVTKQLLCDRFDLLDEDIDIITRSGRNKLRQKTAPQESANGFAVYKDKSSGLLAILSSAIRIMSVKTAMYIMHIIGIIATLAAFAVLMYTKGFMLSTVLLAAAFQIILICIVSAIPYIKRP